MEKEYERWAWVVRTGESTSLPEAEGGVLKDGVYQIRELDDVGHLILTNEREDQCVGWLPRNFRLATEQEVAATLKVGDVVKPVRRVADYANRWGDFWDPEMDAYIGKEGVITDIVHYGIRIEDCGGWCFPAQSLTVVRRAADAAAPKPEPTADAVPPYGVPLTAETVKLVKPGDLVRFTNKHIEKWLGLHVVQSVNAPVITLEDSRLGSAAFYPGDMDFVARADPDNPGWYLPPEGGFPENPVPGKWVECAFGHGGTWKTQSGNIDWDESHSRYKVARFRIVDEPDKEDPVQLKEERPMADYKDGDKVRVVFEGVVEGKFIVSGDYKLMAVQCPLIDRAKSIEVIERAGRPLEVGETVEHCGVVWRVEVTFRGEVCISNATGLVITRPDMIKRPCGTPITEAKQ